MEAARGLAGTTLSVRRAASDPTGRHVYPHRGEGNAAGPVDACRPSSLGTRTHPTKGSTVEWIIALGIGAVAALPVLVIAWSVAAKDLPDEGFDALFETTGQDGGDEALSMWSGTPRP